MGKGKRAKPTSLHDAHQPTTSQWYSLAMRPLLSVEPIHVIIKLVTANFYARHDKTKDAVLCQLGDKGRRKGRAVTSCGLP